MERQVVFRAMTWKMFRLQKYAVQLDCHQKGHGMNISRHEITEASMDLGCSGQRLENTSLNNSINRKTMTAL